MKNVYAQAFKFAQMYIRSAELKSAWSQNQFSTGPLYWMIQNGRYKKTAFWGYWRKEVCADLCTSLKICTEVHLGQLNSNLLEAKATFLWGRHIG